MVVFSACIEMLFTDVPLVERVARAAGTGVQGVEFWGVQGKDVSGLCQAAQKYHLRVTAFACGVPLTDPSKADRVDEDLAQAIALAKRYGIGAITVTTGNRMPHLDQETQEASVIRGLRAAREEAERAMVSLNVELLNTKVDHAGYFLDHMAPAVRIVTAVGSPAVRILYDIYHAQIMEGNLIDTIRQHRDQIGYYHVADVPGRHEPGTGEIHYARVMQAIAEGGRDTVVGLEFRPQGGAEASGDAVRKALAILRG